MRVFLTGGTGFVGRRLLAHPGFCASDEMVALARRPPVGVEATWVEGDLLEPGSWREALSGCDTVVHLAARTGPGTADEHDRANHGATRVLLEAAEAAGVNRFLHVSTIATSYPEHRHYPYARAKAGAEAAVRGSRLDWAILRPTIVLGPGSPVGEGLRGLATAPVLPLFGSGRARIQPVHVDDVAEAIVSLLAEDRWERRVVDFGGRDVVPFGDFLRRLRIELVGQPGPILPVPVRPLVAGLGLWERLGLPRLPATAGQFYAFLHDGVATEGAEARPALAERRGLDELVAETAADPGEYRAVESPFPPTSAAPPPELGPEEVAELDAECRAMTCFLIGQGPSEYALSKYRDGHRRGIGGPADDAPSFDDELVAFARRGPWAVRVADSWATFFSRGGTLRRKLVLLLAILESDGETSARVDSPEPGGPVGFVLRTALRGFGFAASFLIAIAIFAPRRRRSRA